jgi:Domain of unknown function (DUF927)
MNSLQFLQKILPSEGFYYGVRIKNKKATQKTTVDIEALHKYIKSSNCDVYYAIASFSGDKRTAENVTKLKVLVADVDIGNTHKKSQYNTPEEFAAALSKFVEDAEIPPPMMVWTGGGFHLYWVLDTELTLEEWLPYAEGLKAACKQHGFRIDPTRTSDGASILRPIGTTNYKYPDITQLYLDNGPYPLIKFSNLLRYKSEHVNGHKVKLSAMGTPRLNTVGRISPKRNLVEAGPIFEGCNQLQEFKKGKIQREPTWFGCARVLACCVGGEDLFHEYSKADERYDPKEAAKKLASPEETGKPVTCAYFKEHNPDSCRGCAHFDKPNYNPLFIARDKAEVIEEKKNDKELIIIHGEEAYVPTNPFGLTTNSVYKNATKKDGAEIKIPISHYPIIVSNTANSEYSSAYSFTLKCFVHEQWQEFIVDTEEFATNPGKVLGRCGVLTPHPVDIVSYIKKEHEKVKMLKTTTQSYEKFGWKENEKTGELSFLRGNQLYYLDSGVVKRKTVVLSGEAKALEKAFAIRPPESRKEWMKAAQKLFAKGHEWQAVTLLAGALAPLMYFTGTTEGGLNLSTTESEGGRGKTLANMAAISCWGDVHELSCATDDTLNARFNKLATLANLPVGFDEMGRDNPDQCINFMKSFTKGREKERLTSSGARGKEPRKWKTIIISNANNGMIDMIRSGLASDAMADRILEMQATKLPLSKKDMSDAIKEAFIKNAGCLAPHLIELFLLNQEVLRNIPDIADQYMRMFGTSKDRFIAHFMAVMTVGMYLLEDAEIFNFGAQYYIDWMIQQIIMGKKESRALTYVDIFNLFLRQNIHNILVTKEFKAGKGGSRLEAHSIEFRGTLNGRYNRDTGEIFIPVTVIAEFLANYRRSPKEFESELRQVGVLKGRGNKTLAAGTRYPGQPETCYVLEVSRPDLVLQLHERDSSPSPSQS